MTQLRYILAFDTAMAGCSAALYDRQTQYCVSEREPMSRGQSESLVPMIERVVAGAGLSFELVDLIAVTVGPGAFTGLRIGLSTARAMGLAIEKPVIGVTTTDVIARKYFEETPAAHKGKDVVVLLETKRKDFYLQIFGVDGAAQSEPMALEAGEIAAQRTGKATVFLGDAYARFIELAGAKAEWAGLAGYELPEPRVVAIEAARIFEEKGSPENPPEPLYLREADVTMSKKEKRTIAGL